MPTSVATLRASLENHNNAFESLLKLIPAKYYLVQEETEEQLASKYQKHKKKRKEDKQAIKEASKKAKKAKLDPANNKTIVDLQNEALQHNEVTNKGKGKKRLHADAGSDGDDSAEEMVMQVDVELSGDDNDIAGEEDKIVPMPESSGIDALRKKLHAKMAQLRNKGRPLSGEAGDRDELLEERRMQRAALREKRRRETKEKIKREEEVRRKKSKDKRDEKRKGNSTKTQLLVPDNTNTNTSQPGPQSKLTNVTFGNIVGQTSAKKSDKLKTAADPQQALEQLASRKEKLAAMSEEKRKVIEEKQKWDKAEARIEGVKIRDDESKLKKSAKKKEKVKLKSKKDWEERKEQVVASMAAQQKKRTDNIAARNERRKEKKKGKSRPGFEGKTFRKSAAKPKGKK